MPRKERSSSGQVREPIQVYLDRTERSQLDRLARELGVSRAEVLRRALDRLAREETATFFEAFRSLVGAFENSDAPLDLAERHKDYLDRDLKRRMNASRRRSS